MKKIYDVYFKPLCSSCVTVEAESAKDAKKKIEDEINFLTKSEIIQRIIDSLEETGYSLEVTDVEEIDEDY